MKKSAPLILAGVVMAASIFVLIVSPMYSNAGFSNPFSSNGTHRVWHPQYTTIFKLKQYGTLCMPGDPIVRIAVGDVVVGSETKTCEGIHLQFRRVSYNDYKGWMWDFSLEFIDPLEGYFPPPQATDAYSTLPPLPAQKNISDLERHNTIPQFPTPSRSFIKEK